MPRAGLYAFDADTAEIQRLHALATKVGTPLHRKLEKRIEGLLAQQKELEKALKAAHQREAAGRAKDLLTAAETINGIPTVIANLGAVDGDTLQTVADALKSHGFKASATVCRVSITGPRGRRRSWQMIISASAIIVNLGAADGDTLQTVADALKSRPRSVTVLGGTANGAVALVAAVSPEFIAKVQAGKIIQTIAPMVGGKGGGKPEGARGGGKDPSKLDAALAQARTLLG